MPRVARLIIPDEKAVYHIMSRTALDGFPFGDIEKDEFVKIIQKFNKLYFVEIFGYCIMSNHFHILARMYPDRYYTDKEIQKRYALFYGKEYVFPDENIEQIRKKLSNLSEFVRDVKQTFSRYYNKTHNRRGTLWGERYKSVIVENGETLVNCLAYIDLNPLRAGLVQRPEEYRWNSLGYHIQTNNKDNFLSFDFGMKEFGVKNKKERIRRYRRYVYETGAVDRPEKNRSKVIDEKVLKKERKKDFNINRIDRFRYRTRYFSDSGIIGGKEFVANHYKRFKDRFESKREKKPKPVKGLDGVYSLKRLAET